LTDLEKTYGKPSSKTSNPEKGEAHSHWDFPDGGGVAANEFIDDSGQATIRVDISSPEEVFIHHTASNAAGQAWNIVNLVISGLEAKEMKKEARGERTDPWVWKFSDKLDQERKKQDEENGLSWSPELGEGEYVDTKYGYVATVCKGEGKEKGCIIVFPSLPVEMPMLMRELQLGISTLLELSKHSEPLASEAPSGIKRYVYEYTDVWLKVRDYYCTQHPGAKFLDLSGREAACPPEAANHQPR